MYKSILSYLWIIGFILSLLIVCTNIPSNEQYRKLLVSQGYTDVKLLGYKTFISGCDGSDIYNMHFTATNPYQVYN